MIYRFITRTIFYNLLALLKTIFCFLFRFRRTYTGSLLCIILSFVAIAGICTHFTPADMDSNPILFSAMGLLVALILFCGGSMLWITLEGKGEGHNEPKILCLIFGGIGKFFKDISRPVNEQEEIDTEHKKIRKKEKREKREETKKKKMLVMEAKMAEQNKFERFEIMEME